MMPIQYEVLGLLQDEKYCVYSDAEENRNVEKQDHGVDPCEVQG
jgi:hypothetical protein